MIISSIKQRSNPDMYAISLYVSDSKENLCEPTVALGYNAETPNACDEKEARWNYAFWLQNEFFRFGVGYTATIVRKWLAENEAFFLNAKIRYGTTMNLYEQTENITQAFVAVLVEIVKKIHLQKILTDKFGTEIPIIIYELEYYDEIVKQNIEANGKMLVTEFAAFVN